MPILNYGRPDNWELVTELSKAEIFVFRTFVFSAKKKLFKQNDPFLDSLTPNVDFTVPYIYAYDSKLSTYNEDLYINKLRDLLFESNELMRKENKDFKNYRLDIMGTYNEGHIVVMKHKGSDDTLQLASGKSILKKYQK